MDTLWREVRYTFRRLARSPTASFAAVITMALGIGVATGAYSIVDGLMLRGVAFEDAERLVALRRVNQLTGRWSAGFPEHDFAALRDQQQSCEALIGFRRGTVNLRDTVPGDTVPGDTVPGDTVPGDTVPGEPVLPERFSGAWVSPGFLDLLRVEPLLGRGFEPGDAAAGADPVVLIGYHVWQRVYGGTADVVGRTVRVNARPATVIGVLPRDFRFPVSQEVWLPLVLEDRALPRGEARGGDLQVIGRLKDGVPLARAALETSAIAGRLAEAYPETGEDVGIVTLSYPDHVVDSYMGDDGVLILTATFGVPALFVLLIACVNVTNLLLGRAAARRRELAIRSALGSGRLRTAGQVLMEAGVLALAGALLGVMLADFAVRAFGAAMSAVEELPYWVKFEVNGRVLFFAVAVSVLSAFIAGIVPAWRASRPNLSETLHDDARGAASFGLGWLSRSLAVFALALSCALAITAMLSVRSARAARGHELSFDTANVLTARLDLVADVYPEADDQRRLYARIRERVAARPEVAAAAIGTVVPTDTQLAAGSIRYQRPGETYEKWWQMPAARSAVMSPGYFAAFGVDLLAGRDFSAADRADGPLVVIVNEGFARREWPGESPVGQRVHLWLGREKEAADPHAGWAEVVGLVPDLRFSEFSNEDDQQAIYLPLAQHPQRSALVIARTRTDPTAFTATLRRTVQAVDADLPLFFVRSMDQVLESTLFYHQLIGLAFVVFGTMALLLAAVGLYGVTFVSVVQRIPEMGVRMALGAGPQDVVRLILKQGLTKTAIGLGAGLALGWGLGKALESFLFQVRPEDPVTFSAIPSFLLAVSLLAYLVPARRASRVDPVDALRSE